MTASTETPAIATPARIDRGLRFWEIATPMAVLQRCAGNPMLLAAWMAVAATLEEDAALRGSARSLPELTRAVGHQVGLLEEPAFVTLGLLAQLGELDLIRARHGEISIPWADITAASLAEASRHFDAAVAMALPSAQPATQDALPGFTD